MSDDILELLDLFDKDTRQAVLKLPKKRTSNKVPKPLPRDRSFVGPWEFQCIHIHFHQHECKCGNTFLTQASRYLFVYHRKRKVQQGTTISHVIDTVEEERPKTNINTDELMPVKKIIEPDIIYDEVCTSCKESILHLKASDFGITTFAQQAVIDQLAIEAEKAERELMAKKAAEAEELEKAQAEALATKTITKE